MSEDERERRRALNEAVARDANELAEHVAAAWDPPANPLDVRCECASADCDATLRLTLVEYEEVRSRPRQFVVLQEHVDPSVDRVVGTIRAYALVEKIGGVAAEIAEQTDPRVR